MSPVPVTQQYHALFDSLFILQALHLAADVVWGFVVEVFPIGFWDRAYTVADGFGYRSTG